LQLGAAVVASAALAATETPVPSLFAAARSVAAAAIPASGAVTAASGATQPSGAPAADARPNIVFINTDDLDMAEVPTMPKVKSLLADQGATCTNFFVTVSLCCPSRSTFLRGQYAHNTQVLTNGGENGGYARAHALGIENSTVATWLQDAGYHTGLMGKYLNGYPTKDIPETYMPPGWNEWYSPVEGNAYDEFGYKMNENGTVVTYGKDPQDYMTDVLSGKAADFIRRAASAPAPFFLYVATYAPHQPATPAPKYANAFPDAKAPRPPSYNEQDVSDKPAWVQRLPLLSDNEQANLDDLYRKRIETLQSVDDLVENVVNTLQATGALANTYIVFSSDNGFHLGQHREQAGKQAPYEEDNHLPLIVRGPYIEAGKIVGSLIGNVDFAPTFALWANANVPDFVDGNSFARLLAGAAPVGWRQEFLIEHFTQTSAAASGAGTPAATRAAGGIPEFHGLRTADYVYVEYVTKERELYDLTNDADELQNIAGSADPALLDMLSARLAELKTGAGASLRAAEQKPMPALH
jgi:arylsulfatase A-like enzyme